MRERRGYVTRMANKARYEGKEGVNKLDDHQSKVWEKPGGM